jgi:large subunit ribosomal protein L24
MRKIKKGDDVVVLSGKDKGNRGIITKIVDDDRVLVSNINLVKHHKRADNNGDGGIISQEMPLHISNVALFNPQTGKSDKVGFKILENGRKVRIFKSTKEVVER